MRFWLSLVSVMEIDQFVEIARFAEEVGFSGITDADAHRQQIPLYC